MNPNITTSTPIIFEKLIPPPSRKLWSAESPTEQLYRNKWTKYRNSIEKNESWSVLDTPQFVNFENIPDARDSYFDNVDSEKHATPVRTLAKKLPGVDSENNNINIVESLSKCTLSTIKKNDDEKRINKIELMFHSPVCNYHLNDDSHSLSCDSSDITLKPNDNNDIEMNASKPLDDCVNLNNAKSEQSNFANDRKEKSSNNNVNCTVVEPFSFENREKYKQEHRRARRERDSIGKQICNRFRANPVPKFLKLHEKNRLPVTTRADDKKKKIGCTALQKPKNAAQIPKKKTIEPRKNQNLTKTFELRTAIRAKERQRFEEQMREKERQRLELQKKEEAERKKREEEEIAKLRKQLVHKAQPIRHYKTIIPRVEKRPLAEPMSPITHKRRRKI